MRISGIMEEPNMITEQPCPICNKNTLTLMESEREIPYFGLVYLFSMDCSSCNYHKADVEPAEEREPVRYTLEVNSEEDLMIRIVKSSTAKIKIPRITTIDPGEVSNGYITNVEGILNRIKHQIERVKEEEEDKDKQKKAKNMLKKLQKVMWGEDSLKIILEDKKGHSAIISDKAEIKKL